MVYSSVKTFGQILFHPRWMFPNGNQGSSHSHIPIKPASQKSPCLFTLLPREAGCIPIVVSFRPPQGQEHMCLINCCQGWALYVGPSNSIQGRGSLPYQKGAWVWRRATESGCAASFSLFSRQAVSGSFAVPRAVGCQVPLAMGFPRQGYWVGVLGFFFLVRDKIF